MTRHYRVARRDENEASIVTALERCGCLVQRLDAGTGGVPDLLVERAGRLFLLEVKSSARAAKAKGATSERQAAFRRRGWPVHVVLSPVDALRAVGLADWRAIAERRGAAARALDLSGGGT
jgi:hypothetical protein